MVGRAISSGNTLLAFAIGAEKTCRPTTDDRHRALDETEVEWSEIGRAFPTPGQSIFKKTVSR